MRLDPHPWAGDLSPLFVEVWQHLSRGVHTLPALARHPTSPTVTPHVARQSG
ncbi:MAG: hypothetical protein ACJASZ_002279 [Yoonia sp.]|jgi:pyridoxamine 5'-phosphate oxidase